MTRNQPGQTQEPGAELETRSPDRLPVDFESDLLSVPVEADASPAAREALGLSDREDPRAPGVLQDLLVSVPLGGAHEENVVPAHLRRVGDPEYLDRVPSDLSSFEETLGTDAAGTLSEEEIERIVRENEGAELPKET